MLCGGTGCVAGGTNQIKEKFEELIKEYGLEDRVAIRVVGCFGLCSQGPFVRIFPEDVLYRLVQPDDIEEIVLKDLLGHRVVTRLVYEDPHTGEKIPKMEDIPFYRKQKRIALHGCGIIDPDRIEEALGCGGYQGLMNALSMPREEVIKLILDSGLRGRGGGGFPTGRKWQFAMNADSKEKYVVCNGDEGDPGAFMDRSILEGDPHVVLEAMAIAGYAIGASQGYIYVRAEYPIAIERLEIAIKQAREYGLLGKDIFGTGFDFDIDLRLGAGAFVCGEETALMTSIEGNRGEPRPRPPYPAVKGLFGKPTTENNVETFANVPWIIQNGGSEFAKMGTEGSKGTKVFALTGKIKRGGLVEIPMGKTLRDVIFDIGGGIKNDKKFKAVQMGGPSGGCIPENMLDTTIDYENIAKTGAIMGSGGMIVMDEKTCMVDMAKFFMDFTSKESCGKCVPCRIGTTRMLEILQRIVKGEGEESDIETLVELGEAIKTGALCGLGNSAPNPVLTTIKYFRQEYEAHIKEKKCPAKKCSALISYNIVADKCKGCSLCSKKCPVNAISGVIKTPYKIDNELCVRCGQCIENCRFGAIEILSGEGEE